MGTALARTLGPLSLWGLGVGYVISGMYFGWNLGLPEAGPVGFLVATLLVTVTYVAFVLGYAELACALPRAGGAFVYATRAFGPWVGLLAGVGQWVEFVFAPPAIAAAIGAYLSLFFPSVPPNAFAVAAYVVFTLVNMRGVSISAALELGMAALAVFELLVFAAVSLPHFSMATFVADQTPRGALGVLSGVPFAIWFYLGIEGLANVAEEARDPARDIPRGFGAAMATLVLLAVVVLFAAVGVAGWRAVVYPPGSEVASDSPLPLALGRIVAASHPLYRMLIGIGLFGLLASFHGILLAAGRITFEFGRVGWAPAVVGKLSARGTPTPALLVNLVLGCAALATGKTADIITLSVLGALVLYGVSTLALLSLRRRLPDLARPYLTPLYPVTPIVALCGIALSLVAVVVSNPRMSALFALLVALAYGWLLAFVPRERRDALGRQEAPADA